MPISIPHANEPIVDELTADVEREETVAYLASPPVTPRLSLPAALLLDAALVYATEDWPARGRAAAHLLRLARAYQREVAP